MYGRFSEVDVLMERDTIPISLWISLPWMDVPPDLVCWPKDSDNWLGKREGPPRFSGCSRSWPPWSDVKEPKIGQTTQKQ